MKELFNRVQPLVAVLRAKGFLHLLFSNAFMYFLGFLTQLYVAWVLTPDDLGRIKFLQVFGLAANIIAGFGLNSAVQKLCSENRPEGEKVFHYRFAFRYTAAITSVLYLVILALTPFGVFSNDGATNRLIPLFALSILPFSVNTLSLAYLEALKLVRQLGNLQTVTKLLNMVLIIVSTRLFFLSGYIWGYVAGFAVTAAVFAWYIRRHNQGITPAPVPAPFKEQMGVAGYSLANNFLTLVNLNIDIIFINYLVPSRSEIGYYSLASTLLVALYLVNTTIQQVAIPYFSERGSNGAEWYRVFRKYYGYNFAASLVLALASLLAGPPLIRLLFAGKYDGSVYYFMLLVAGWWVRSFYTLPVVAVFGSGLVRYNFYAFLIATMVTVAAAWYCISAYGVAGAGYSNIAGGVIYLAVIMVFFSLAKKAVMQKGVPAQ